MKRVIFTTWIATFWLSAATAAEREARLPEKHRAFFKAHCLDCHDSAAQEGKVNLEEIPFRVTTIAEAERWKKVLNSLNSGEMPPEDQPQPANEEKADFLDDLSRMMVTARAALADSGGKITMRRLNRREYRNTIHDLLGVEIDIRDLPPDGGAGRFDTVGASLFMSSDQFEQYLALGRAALDEAFTRYRQTQSWKQRREVEEHANNKVGGLYKNYFKRGHDVAKAWLDSDRSKPPSAFGDGIPDEAAARFRIKQFEDHGPAYRRYLEDPLTQTGALLTLDPVYKEEFITLPPEHPTSWRRTTEPVENVPPGDYTLRFRIGAIAGTEKGRHFVDVGTVSGEGGFGLIGTFHITGTTAAPQVIELPVYLSSTSSRRFVIREKRDVKLDLVRNREARKANGVGPVTALWIDWVEWEGPRSMADTPEWLNRAEGLNESDQARQIISKFTGLAFRDSKPGEDFINRLVSIFAMRRKAGDSFQEALKDPLSAVLASPGFLYLHEPGEEGKRRDLSPRELAIRLSFFLWSAPPDRQLLALARSGELVRPEVLARQVDRLLDDPRSYEFVTGFVHQWLYLERLDFFQFDTSLYPDFDDSTRSAAREEVYQSFAHLLRENAGLGQLLKSDYVVVNGLLAHYYGLDGVAGDDFRKVPLPANSPRGGLLGMAAILAMGSNGQHTSPVERGAWVLRKLLDDPPPPAPPNVPQITRLEGKLLTTRERLAAHMEQAQCAQCHRKIDPIGFGLENFDAAGKWRLKDHYEKRGVGRKEWDIDPSGRFFKGPAFQDYFELRDLIADRQSDFARGFVEALIEYALGRPFGFSDEELATGIVAQAREKNFALRQFITTLVLSEPFQRK